MQLLNKSLKRLLRWRNKVKKINKGIIFALIYTAIMGVGMYISKSVFNVSYADQKIVVTILPVEILLSILSVYAYLKYYKNTAFKKLKFTNSFIIYSIFMLLMFVLYIISGAIKYHKNILLYVLITNFLVGFSEELMYRGVVLSSFLEKYNVQKSILYSSILFALLHSVNILSGSSITNVSIQLVLTFIYGLTTACFRLKVNNILPFIFYHFIWDLMVSTTPFVESYPLSIVWNLLLGILLTIVMLKDILKNNKSNKLMN